MDFISSIIERRSALPVIAKCINEGKLPTYIYGAGGLATALYSDLNRSCRIDAFLVDKKYHKVNMEYCGKKVFSIEQIIGKCEECNILVGHYSEDNFALEKKIRATLKVRNVFFYDGGLGVNGKNGNYEYSFVENNKEELNNVYNLLCDQRSKNTMSAYFNQKISGNYKYLNDLFVKDQYFAEDILIIDKDEIFLDCGAYIGDTIKIFVKKTFHNGGYNKIYAFEPDELNYLELKKLVKLIPNIFCFNKGVWSERKSLKFSSGQGVSSTINDYGETIIEVDSIDNVLKGKKVTFIKMDIEGAELQALEGAKNSIRKYQPKLAICVYHNIDDLLEIPNYVKSLNPEYKLYLRAHKNCTDELVMYAIV